MLYTLGDSNNHNNNNNRGYCLDIPDSKNRETTKDNKTNSRNKVSDSENGVRSGGGDAPRGPHADAGRG